MKRHYHLWLIGGIIFLLIVVGLFMQQMNYEVEQLKCDLGLRSDCTLVRGLGFFRPRLDEKEGYWQCIEWSNENGTMREDFFELKYVFELQPYLQDVRIYDKSKQDIGHLKDAILEIWIVGNYSEGEINERQFLNCSKAVWTQEIEIEEE